MPSVGRHVTAQPPGTIPRVRGGGRRELAVLAAGATVYFGGRLVVQGSEATATRNAQRLIDLEATLGIDIERDIQQYALDNDWFRVLGNFSYVWFHWPLLLTILFVLFKIDRRHYHQVRNALFVSGAIGLVLFATFPMAPPRFMPGFVGTVSDEARRHYLNYPLGWSNKFAAFPSFHIGWTLVACLALAANLRQRWWQAVALVPAAMVGISVISTGNHYVVDTLTGAAIAVVAYWYWGRHPMPTPTDQTDRADDTLGRAGDQPPSDGAAADEGPSGPLLAPPKPGAS